MDPQCHSSSLSCELRIIRARNINLKYPGEVFVRCYLSAGTSKRVRLDSQLISSKSDLTWNQTFSLDCLGTQDSINLLKQGTIVFELRHRRSAPFISRMKGSKLLGRAEIPWKDAFVSPNMEIEKWAVMISKTEHVYDDVKPPAVQIAMKVQDSAEVMKRKKTTERRWDMECGCRDGGCNSCVDYEFFAIGAALEAL